MLLGETIGVALGALRANKLRSFLTMLGVVIGVGAVIAVVALGRGAQQSVAARISALGTTLLTVFPGQVVRTGVAAEADRAPMTISDARALEAANSPLITAVQPEMSRFFQVQHLTVNTNTSVIGTTANYLDVRKYTLGAGRMFTALDDKESRRVVVLGSAVVENLGVQTPSDLIGQNVRIRGLQFEVIGVLSPKGSTGANAVSTSLPARSLARRARSSGAADPSSAALTCPSFE